MALEEIAIAEQRALLARLLREKAAAAPRTYPLSFPQRRFWFMDQLEPGSSAYNSPMSVRLRGTLRFPALERAFNEVVRRHGSLRTSFPLLGDEAVQQVAPFSPFHLPLIDLGALPEPERTGELDRLAADDVQYHFDLAHGPLFRLKVVRATAREHVALLTFHHIVFDGWSRGVLIREIALLYEALAAGRPPRIPELPIQYVDFAHWQRRQDSQLDGQLAYWRRQLAGSLPTLDLPTDHPRGRQSRFRGGSRWLSLRGPLVAALGRASEQHGVTLFILILAVYAIWLNRYTMQDEILVGTPIANRKRQEVEGLIGLFINTLVLRLDLQGGPTFTELLMRVKRVALDAYSHQDVPFERVVAEVQPERDLSRGLLFQTMFVLLNAPMRQLELPDLTMIPLELDSGAAKFDLTFFLWQVDSGLRGGLEYNSQLFEAATVQRMLGHLEVLLQGIVAEPGARLSDLPFLSSGERSQLLVEWNVTDQPPAGGCLHRRIEAQVVRTPDAVAIASEGLCLTYGELDARANRLAHALRRHGVGAERCVGVFLERTPELVVALLSILKSGGAYLPLDPAHPPERLAYMLRDAAAAVLLTQASLLSSLKSMDLGVPVVCLDRRETTGESAARLEITADPASLAYVIYTSGSTGKPKGTRISHHNVVRLFDTTSRWFEFDASDTWTFFHSHSFDFSVWEIWGALLYGGRLIVIPYLTSRATDAFTRLLLEERVTVLNQTPSAFRQLSHAMEAVPADAHALRLVIFGGEALELAGLRAWLLRYGDRRPRLVNMYGITETTVHVTYRPIVARDLETAAHRSPIGMPIPDLRVHILSSHGQLLPIGVPGELHVGGDGLSSGYVGRSELTAERFVPDPFSTLGERLYRSGDLVRRLANGDLEYLGRIDHQMKVRGFRIEPGEIEAALARHSAVAQAVVLTRREGEDHRLIAYLVADLDSTPTDSGTERQPDRVREWKSVFDRAYGAGDDPADVSLNLTGWDSSYTGLPIPQEEMREWLADTIADIVSLNPRRVLEIGVGTGMLLYRLAPGCQLYWGTDISAEAVAFVERNLELIEKRGARVRLFHRPADDLPDLEPGSFDTVVINSVAQYFPNLEYLIGVLESAVAAVAPGGSIFLGDLRSLPLWEAFQTSVELFKADSNLPAEALRQRIRSRMAQERELLIDPAFFFALQARLPRIGAVRVFPKRGRSHNELTAFRYQVVLSVGPAAIPAPQSSWIDWQNEGLDLPGLHRRLTTEAPERLAIRNVPNARVAAAAAAVCLLKRRDEIGTVAQVRLQLAGLEHAAVDPEDFWALADELPYAVALEWSGPGADGRFEVILRRRDVGSDQEVPMAAAPEPPEVRGWDSYANDPLRAKQPAPSSEALRAFVKEGLPEYMVPASFLWVEELPLTINGKVDRRSLLELDAVAAQREVGYEAPRGPLEELVAGVWRQVLGVETIGARDNFFELGGHSLLATQVVARLRAAFGLDLPLKDLFEAPTVERLAARLGRLATPGVPAAPILPVSHHEGLLPLSFAQERLWFLAALEPESTAYTLVSAVRITGALDQSLVACCFTEIVRRHESLRTTFPAIEGRPHQQVHPPGNLPVARLDLSALPRSMRDSHAMTLAGQGARMPFDLVAGPLLRVALVVLGAGEHLLLMSMHHIVSDGWSMGILVKELAALYEAFDARQPSPLPELAIQYADFAVWQRGQLAGELLAEQLDWWRKRLAGAPPALELPRRSSLTNGPHLGLTRPLRLPPRLTNQLKALSLRQEATLFMTVLAAFDVLLLRYSGQDDLVLGTPVANRRRPEVEGLIGFFVNTLAVRSDLSGDPTFRELLARVREMLLGAYAHQDLPFERLVAELNPDRELGRTPIFQAMLAFQNAPGARLAVRGLALEQCEVETDTARFELLLNLSEEGDEIAGFLQFRADLFETAMMDRLLSQWGILLEGLVGHPGFRLSELPLLGEAERHLMSREWNDRRTLYPEDSSAAVLFAAQADRTPERVAVVCDGEVWTYRELASRSSLLAQQLVAEGLDPQDVVGILAERSLGFLAAVLAVWQAGCAYLPLDPHQPLSRHLQVLQTAQPRLLLLGPGHFDSSAPLAALPVDATRILPLEIRAEAATAALPTPSVQHGLAYVIFTSGSTGVPKGAMVEQRGMVNHLWAKIGDLALTDRDAVAQTASQCFDISVWQLVAPLMVGGQVHIYPEAVAHDPFQLLAAVARDQVSVLEVVPSLLATMLAEEPDTASRTLAQLRWLVLTGEALPPKLGRDWAAICPEVPLLNAYGPTECSDDVTHHVLRNGVAADRLHVPIGRPVANTRLHVLDRSLDPQPVGVRGELWVGGDGVGRGYLRDPQRTALAFLPDPFGAPGDRLYRTGDLGRWLSDGTLEFLGRIDHQIKLRGFRIELGEIEAVLGAHPGVAGAAVLVRRTAVGDPRLVAFYASFGADPGDSELHAFLHERLPEYMVPSIHVPLPTLPLSANGKVDRRALAELEIPELGDAPAFHVAPRDPVEELLATLWCQLLGRERISVHDNFFHLGGHSLLATQLAARVRAAFGVEIALRELFEAPTVSALAKRIGTATAAGCAIWADPIRPAPPGATALSFAQERLWFLDQLQPHSADYNLPSAVRVTGPLDELGLERCLDEVVRRHESLRTTFTEVAGRPLQVVHPARPLVHSRIDLSTLAGRRREIGLQELARADAKRPFDLSDGPLLRATLLRLAPGERVLLITMHHVISDGWSMGVFLREMVELYAAFAAGRPSPLPELPVQYRDFALWQRELLTDEALAEQLAWWREHLAGAPRVIDLPGRYQRARYSGAVRRLSLSGPLFDFRSFVRHEGATPFMLLLATFKVLLLRYTGQDDLVVGTPVANRRRPEVEGLIGFFVNTLAIRSDLSGNPSFRRLLARVRETALGAYAHQDLPFERLVAEINPDRGLDRTPIFQVMLAFQNMPAGRFELPELAFEAVDIDNGTPRFELLLTLAEESGGLSGTMHYRSDLFEAAVMDRLGEHLGALLHGLTEAPDKPLTELPLLRLAERHQITVEWNDHQSSYPAHLPFPTLFKAQAARTPEALAAVFEGKAWSYRELDQRSSQLARHLAAASIGPDSCVAVLAERGLGFLAAILATWTAGGAYLPLDPRHPVERHRQILSQAQPQLLLAGDDFAELAEVAADGMYPPVLTISSLLEKDTLSSLEERGGPDNLAYLMYTSGSTGLPKGVMVEQRGMINHLYAKISDLGLTARDRVAQTASQCFDISVWQLVAPLLLGGSVHIYPDDVTQDSVLLLDRVAADRITILETVPSLLRALLAEPTRPDLPHLRWMIPTGEALPPDLCHAWALAYPLVPLLNAYGPTECSDDVAHQPIPAGSHRADGPVPIGRPVANTRLHILDSALHPVPIEVIGQIWVAGDGVGRGYLNDPERTAGVFLPDLLAAVPGARMYGTGDLGRLRADGAMDFLGRIDRQVKVRGNRVELREIESVLRKHVAVAEAVVLGESRAGDSRLVAYYVAHTGIPDSLAELRSFLAERLPGYMVPSGFVALAALPLTANGKVDYAALPPLAEMTWDEAEYLPPRTAIELRVVSVWEEVLGRAPIGVDENFFDIGGHSLLATQVMSRLRVQFAVDLPLRVLFEGPTVAALAAHLESATTSGQDGVVLPFRKVDRSRTPSVSFAQERLWFLAQFEPESAAYNLPTAVRVTGELVAGVLARCFDEICRRHDSLRTTFTSVDGRPQAILREPRPLVVPIIDLSVVPEPSRAAEGRRLARQEAALPFDLATGPLLRLSLLRQEPSVHVLLVTMHHVVSDGWSMGIFIRELTSLYPALSVGRSSPLRELSFQYQDYALWQRELLAGEALDRQLGYWLQHLAGAPPVLDLPGRRLSETTVAGSLRKLRLSPNLTGRLRTLGRARGTTLFMLLLAAFDTLLYRSTGQSDVVVGTPIANRGRPEIEGLIGFFVNTLVMRSDLARDPSWPELLGRVRDDALGAFAHQDLPFERLVAEINPERELSRSPIFQVMFTVQNAPPGRLEIPGLTFELLENEGETPMFELLLDVVEVEDALLGNFQYRSDLFDSPTIARLSEQYAALLEDVVERPTAPLSALRLLRPGERHQIEIEWNDHHTALDTDRSFPELFEAQATASPEAIAAVCQGEAWTYRELARRSDHLARQLAAAGAGRESLVAILDERGLWFLAAILAVFKAGGAYLPLDPRHPVERHLQILREGRPSLLMVGEGHEDQLVALEEALPSNLMPARLRLAAAVGDFATAGAPPFSGTGPENLAYVIYTSGSTGVPKGAMIDQRAMVNHLFANLDFLSLNAADAIAQTASQCFDISVWQFLAPLLCGGRVHIYPDEVAHDPVRLVESIGRDGVTVLEIVPSLMRAVLAEETRRGTRALCRLRWLIPTGEALPPDLCRDWVDTYPGVPLVNAYGPAECADDVTLYVVPASVVTGEPRVPIGRPVANLRIHTLDDSLRSVPIGVAGEIWVGGEGVGRGYLNDPRRTAEAFLPDPFAEVAGQRIYRTGDLGRWLPDGNLDFLGRIDHQVKLRGFRIEPGEIEAGLSDHPDVFATVVLAKSDGPGPRLVAYLVPRLGCELDARGLRAFLKERLPEHMVPASFVVIAELPVNANGKVDRGALAQIDDTDSAPGEVYTAPGNDVEEILAELFCSVIGVERVGIYDNFFDRGGHSLLATQVVSRVRDQFQVDLALRTFFDAPTVAELAGLIERLIIEQLQILSDEDVDSFLVDDQGSARGLG